MNSLAHSSIGTPSRSHYATLRAPTRNKCGTHAECRGIHTTIFSMISLFHIVLRKFRVVLRGCTKCNVVQPLRLLVDVRFQIYFTPLSGVLFTFPSRYLFTIDLQKYLALPVSAGGFPRAIRVSRYSRL